MPTAAIRPLHHAVAEFLAGSDRASLQDPYPLYDRLRREAPVFRFGPGLVVLTRYGDVKGARLDPRLPSPPERLAQIEGRFAQLSPQERTMYEAIADFEREMLSRHDGADHRRYRTALGRAFTPKRMAEWPSRVQEIVDAELASLPKTDVVDLLRFAYRVPLLVIMELMGAPAEDADRVKHWGDALVGSLLRVPLQPEFVRLGFARLQEYRTYAAELVERHRSGDGTDRTSVVALLLDAHDGERVTQEELVATFMHFLFAGHETTTNMIASGLFRLLQNREQWELLVGDPAELAPTAVEEILRYESPSQFSIRQTDAAAEIGGVTLERGLSVLLANGAANRDPAMFQDPDRFDVTRTPNDHLGLGWGPHFCLGSPVARLEGRLALETFARRFPELELAVGPEALQWSDQPRIRALQALPVRLGRDHG